MYDLHPDELLSGSCWRKNGIRESSSTLDGDGAFCGDIIAGQAPWHIDLVALDDVELARLQTWFKAEPLPAPKSTLAPPFEVKTSAFGYSKDLHTLSDVSFTIGRGDGHIKRRNGAGKSTLPFFDLRFISDRGNMAWTVRISRAKTSAAGLPGTSAMSCRTPTR